jgi:Sulfate permease family
MEKSSNSTKEFPLLLRVAPGLANLLEYRREWLRHDAVAGVSVAAVALATAIAYAQLIHFDPVVGHYASILPLVVYAVFGTSRHLIVNPDAATCAMVGATLTPLTAHQPNSLVSLSMALAVFTGIFCILAGFLRLGFVADFLSKPILVGFPQRRGHPHLPRPDRQGLWLWDGGARAHPFAPGVLSKASADPFGNARRGRANNRGVPGRQAMAAAVARTLAGGSFRCGARSKHWPGWKRGRSGGGGAGGIAAARVAGIRPRVHQAPAGRTAGCGAFELQQRDGGRPKLRGPREVTRSMLARNFSPSAPARLRPVSRRVSQSRAAADAGERGALSL